MIQTWQGALDALFNRPNWETSPAGSRGVFKLDRIAALLDDLGAPHLAWPAVHVAGTNGKGSTCALVSSILETAGHKVGLYTSPHMHTVRERIRVNGTLVEEAFVIDWLNAHDELLRRHRGLTTFELLTAIGFSYFASREVDIAVVEVGLGGRLDTTNVVRPAVSVVTPIGLDHMAVLGDSVEAIAADKAGIFRPGVPVVSAPQVHEALAVLEAHAELAPTRLVLVGRDIVACPLETGFEVVAFANRPEGPLRFNVQGTLPGSYQRDNTLTAVGAAAVLSELGWSIPPAAVESGVASASWPGRMEELSAGAGRDVRVIVDGAHNSHAARALVAALDDAYPGVRRGLIVGYGREKDAAALLRVLLPAFDWVVVTASRHPKAVAAGRAAELVKSLGVSGLVASDPAEALDAALDRAEPGDLVVATGSIFVAAAVREAALRLAGAPLPPMDGPPHG